MKENTAIKVFVIALIAAFAIHQAYSSLYNPVTTQNAEFSTMSDGLSASAIIIRQENVITSNSSGTLHYKISNGNRVSKGGTIADVYNDASASITVSKIDELTEKIADIEEISGYNDVAATDLDLLKDRVNKALDDFVISCSTGDFSYTEEYESALLSAENRKQFVTGETVDFSAKLEGLKSELDSLNAKLPTPIGSITSDKSGYFVSVVDGYENILSCEKKDEITPEKLDELNPEKVEENAIGKVVYDYDWYLAVTVAINDSLKYKTGDTVTIKTSIRNNPSLKAKVEKINNSKDLERATILLNCQEMNSELATLRTANITIVSKEYSGLKIPKKALRVVDGKSGVYVVSGLSIRFVKIDILYTGEDFIICKQQTENNSSVLRLYDEVVVKGKNLYDGKIIG